jgi:hypothetical protein
MRLSSRQPDASDFSSVILKQARSASLKNLDDGFLAALLIGSDHDHPDGMARLRDRIPTFVVAIDSECQAVGASRFFRCALRAPVRMTKG